MMIRHITRGLQVILLTACAIAAPVHPHAARADVPAGPAQLEKFIGHYQLGPYITFTVRRLGDHLVMGFRHRRDVRIDPTGATTFTSGNRRMAAVVLEAVGRPNGYKRSEGLAAVSLGVRPPVRPLDFEIDFDVDAAGNVTGFALPGNGTAPHAHRIDAETAENIEMLARMHIDDHVATPGAPELLRRHLASVLAGHPDYEDMTPEVAATIKATLPSALPEIQKLGPVKFLYFTTVTSMGADIYNVSFEHGQWECRITVGPDGKIAHLEWLQDHSRWWHPSVPT